MKEIENVEEEASVDGMREREGHLVGGGGESQSTISGEENPLRLPLTLTLR